MGKAWSPWHPLALFDTGAAAAIGNDLCVEPRIAGSLPRRIRASGA
jgi:hypothetical protein